MSRPDRWTHEEVDRFLTACTGTRLEAAWYLVALARMRTGELLALRWADVDLGAESIRVENAVPGVAYQAISPAPIAARTRLIDIHPALCAVLSQHRQRQHAGRAEWAGHYSDYDLVVCHENGRPMHPRRIVRVFQRITQRECLRPISLPALRRSCCAPARPEIAA